jgi:hypothetical protein
MQKEIKCAACGNDGFFKASITSNYSYERHEYGENYMVEDEGEFNIYVNEGTEIEISYSSKKEFTTRSERPLYPYVCDDCGFIMLFTKEKEVSSSAYEKNLDKVKREYYTKQWEWRKRNGFS